MRIQRYVEVYADDGTDGDVEIHAGDGPDGANQVYAQVVFCEMCRCLSCNVERVSL